MVYVKEKEITKKEINRIGERIKKEEITSEDYTKISEYRQEHSKVTTLFVNSIKNKKIIKDNKAIISRRLKRMPSIIRKLKRFEKMKLSSMQDLGGIRVIFEKLEDVITFSKELKEKTYPENSKNNFQITNEKNYIDTPKEDGYRSIHQIYKYNGSKETLKDYKIELQIRTKLQHQWATAIEIFDIIERTNLKFGEKDRKYNEFFNLVSVLFRQKEQKIYSDIEIKETRKRLKQLNSTYNILDKLDGLTTVKEKVPIDSGNLLMMLDILNKKISYTTNSDYKTINLIYKTLEEEYKDNNFIEIVLVTLDNLKELKKAYPNYFLDAKLFIKEVLNEIEKVQ